MEDSARARPSEPRPFMPSTSKLKVHPEPGSRPPNVPPLDLSSTKMFSSTATKSKSFTMSRKQSRGATFQSHGHHSQEFDKNRPVNKGFFPFYPDDTMYMVWWYTTMGIALVTAVLDPFKSAFGAASGFYPYNDFWAVTDFITTVIFSMDMLFKFFLAYEDPRTRLMITDGSKIASNYLKRLFWADLLFAFPFDGVILGVLGAELHGSRTALYIGLLRYLKLGRLYRIFDFFAIVDHSMMMSQINLMLLRNNTYIIYTCHWFACIFYFCARVEQFSPASWVGRAIDRFEGQPTIICYVYSMYFSVTAFSGLGDQDFYSASPLESIVVSLYMLFNVVLGAYILGTVTLVVVKGDEKSKQYREHITSLKQFSENNDLPPMLHRAMKEHLELHFQNETASDEAVLSQYPATIKRKVLRHLYMQPTRQCYMFHGCKIKFLDAVMAASRVEVFLPKVQIITAGDIVNELFVVIDGEVEVIRGSDVESLHSKRGDNTSISGAVWEGGNRSYQPTHRDSLEMTMVRNMSAARMNSVLDADIRGPSDCFGAMAFFAEVPSLESVFTRTTVKVLTISRSVLDSLKHTFSDQMSLVLQNLQSGSEEALLNELSEAMDQSQLEPEQLELMREYVDPDGKGGLTTGDLPPEVVQIFKEVLTQRQLEKLSCLEQIRNAVRMHLAKEESQRTYDLLQCANVGDVERLKGMLLQGMDPNSSDYDGRTAMHVAAHEGHEAVVKALLDAGADPMANDVFSSTPMFEAIKSNNDHIIDLLLKYKASIGMEDADILTYHIMNCVFTGDLAMLSRLIRAGIDVNVSDYDGRTPLHLAAAESNLPAVKLLVEQGRACMDLHDRWGFTPLDEATRINAHPVMEYLKSAPAPAPLPPPRPSQKNRTAQAGSVGNAKKRFLGSPVRKNSSSLLSNHQLTLLALEGPLFTTTAADLAVPKSNSKHPTSPSRAAMLAPSDDSDQEDHEEWLRLSSAGDQRLSEAGQKGAKGHGSQPSRQKPGPKRVFSRFSFSALDEKALSEHYGYPQSPLTKHGQQEGEELQQQQQQQPSLEHGGNEDQLQPQQHPPPSALHPQQQQEQLAAAEGHVAVASERASSEAGQSDGGKVELSPEQLQQRQQQRQQQAVESHKQRLQSKPGKASFPQILDAVPTRLPADISSNGSSSQVADPVVPTSHEPQGPPVVAQPAPAEASLVEPFVARPSSQLQWPSFRPGTAAADAVYTLPGRSSIQPPNPPIEAFGPNKLAPQSDQVGEPSQPVQQ